MQEILSRYFSEHVQNEFSVYYHPYGANILEISLEILTGNKFAIAITKLDQVTGVAHFKYIFFNYSVITQSNP